MTVTFDQLGVGQFARFYIDHEFLYIKLCPNRLLEILPSAGVVHPRRGMRTDAFLTPVRLVGGMPALEDIVWAPVGEREP